MKSFVVVLALVAAVVADVAHLPGSHHQHHHHSGGPESQAQIEEQNSDVRPDGYDYKFRTNNGIEAQESGALVNAGGDEPSIASQGYFQYPAPDGSVYRVNYVVDANGFQPQGAHLPTPPPTQAIPEAIARSLEYIRTHPPKPEPFGRA